MDIIFKILNYFKKHSNLIKTALLIALAVVYIFQTSFQAIKINSYESEVSGSRVSIDLINEEKNTLEAELAEYKQLVADKDKQIEQLQKDVQDLETVTAELAALGADGSFKSEKDYSQAIMLWGYLRGLGLNEYVCAGILGNIMAEVGGQTLDFSNWEHWSQGTHYGICQWGGSRKDRLLKEYGKDFNSQVAFLGVELFEVIPRDNAFYNMQDEQEAALYFAKYYERCSSKYYAVRQTNATRALDYFTK